MNDTIKADDIKATHQMQAIRQKHINADYVWALHST